MKCAMTGCGWHVVFDPNKKKIKETGEMEVYKFYRCINGKKLHLKMKAWF